MAEASYRIVFRGKLVDGISRAEAEANLKSRFKYNDAVIAKLFAGKGVVLKSGIDLVTAQKYERALAAAGLVCDLRAIEAVEEPAPVGPVAEPQAPAEPQPPVEEPFARPEPEVPDFADAVAVSGPSSPVASEPEAESPVEPVEDVFAESFPVQVEVPAEAADQVAADFTPVIECATADSVAPEAVSAVAEEPAAGVPEPLAGEVSAVILDAMKNTKPWVRLISVLLFIGAALGFGAILIPVLVGLQSPAGAPPMMLLMALQAVFCLIYLIPAFYLAKYASAIGALLKGGGQFELETALGYQKSFWRFSGILALLGLVLGMVGMLAAILVPAMIY